MWRSSSCLRIALVTLLAVLVAGCGSNSFLGRRVDNFTAYYNKFYNAQKAFRSGVKALERNDQPVDRNEYLALFTNPTQASNSREFENAILKSADVLRAHRGSKWVDDALMVIGKSYFYQQNYVGADQKFNEVIELGSPLQDEARFWLARSLIAGGSYDLAREHLLESLGREGLSPRWEPMLRLALGELYLKRQMWAEAAEELQQGLERVRDRDLGSRAQFLLGQVYETLGDHEKARQAYDRVRDFGPVYELAFAAELSSIRVEGLHGDADQGLRRLRRMERDDKNFANRYELAYLRGRIYAAQGRPEDALVLYDEILYDADAPINTLRGRVHYALGELFRDAYADFVLAAAHFDTARTAISTGGSGGARAGGATQTLYAPEAITDAAEQAETFKSFADAHEQVARMDSLLHLGSLDDETFATTIMKMREELGRQMAEQQKLLERQQAMRRFQDAGAGTLDQNQATPSADATANSDAGFLFHRDPILAQEARLNFRARWGDRPLVPNWRRRDAINALAAAAEGGSGAAADAVAAASEAGGVMLPVIDYSDVPRDSASQAEMRAERAMARYELANVLFLSMSRPDSALAWYRLVIEEDAEQPVARRAYYALAEVQRALGDTATADRIFREVLERYPDSEFADRVRDQLGIGTVREEVQDSSSLARTAYDAALLTWRRGAYEEALHEMIRVAQSYAKTEVAPQAILAAGMIYMDWAVQDSLDLFAPLPIKESDSYDALAELLRAAPVAPATAPGAAQAGRGARRAAPAASPQATSPQAASAGRTNAGAETGRPTPPGGAGVAGTNGNLVAETPAAAAVPDSAAVPDPAGYPALATAASDEIDLMTLFANVQRRYPNTSLAGRADALMEVLAERQPKPDSAETVAPAGTDAQLAAAGAPADTLAGGAESAAAVDTTSTAPDDVLAENAEAATTTGAPPAGGESSDAGDTNADSSGALDAAARARMLALERESGFDAAVGGERPDEGVAPATGDEEIPQAVLDAMARGGAAGAGAAEAPPDRETPAETSPILGSEPIDPAAGGWTLVLAASGERGQIENMVRGFTYLGFRTALLTDKVGDATRYRAAVGQFSSREEARQALAEHAVRLPDGTQIEQISLSTTN